MRIILLGVLLEVKTMIVDTMTLEEVGEAILKASNKSINRIERLLTWKDKDYKKIIIKGQKERFDFLPIPFENDGIKFYICPYSKGKKDYKKYGIMYGLFAHVFYHGTNWYCMITADYVNVIMFCNHFFERYIERFLKDDSVVNVEMARKFFKETDYLYINRPIENPKHPNCVYASMNIGIACGEIVSKHVTAYKTFLCKDTLTIGNKRKTYDEGQKAFETTITNDWGLREIKGVA